MKEKSQLNLLKNASTNSVANLDIFKRCTGCGVCAFVCPKKAISLREDINGSIKSYVNAKECVNCGLCFSICHLNQGISSNNIINVINAHSKDDDVLKSSRSGGLFYEFSKHVLKLNGIVYGVILNNANEVVHERITKLDELWKVQGSKYVQSNFSRILKSLVDDIKSKKHVILGGTPCQIASVKLLVDYLKLDYSNLILVDLICHGTPSRKFYRDYLKNEYDNVMSVNFRDKENGWEEHYETLYTNKGKLHSDIYTYFFYSHNIINEHCFACKYKNLNRYGDITLGDYWGINKDGKVFNYYGNSIMLLNNKKGSDFYNILRSNFNNEVVDVNFQNWLQPALICNFTIPLHYYFFWHTYNKKGYKYTKLLFYKPKPLFKVYKKTLFTIYGILNKHLKR